jgi:AcrR family transcriptional regulator
MTQTTESTDAKDRRREELKDAAIDIFSEQGFHATKVSEIVAEAGVSQGTFYNYYDGKRQLFEEILHDFLSLVVRTIGGWTPANLDSRDDLRRELTRVGTQLTEVLEERRGLTAIFFKESSAETPEFGTIVREFHETLAGMLTHFNEVLHERGLIEDGNFRVLAFMTIGMVERIIMEHVVYDNFDSIPHETIVEHLVAHYLSGTQRPLDSIDASPEDEEEA